MLINHTWIIHVIIQYCLEICDNLFLFFLHNDQGNQGETIPRIRFRTDFLMIWLETIQRSYGLSSDFLIHLKPNAVSLEIVLKVDVVKIFQVISGLFLFSLQVLSNILLEMSFDSEKNFRHFIN